ncbi:MAG: alpha/beta hydrolase [Dissulfurispiraceae bacterium]|jgi:pimeloyl-ACP methyl ester carboxylesterase
MPKIDVGNGTKIYVDIVGTGKPILFIHGWLFPGGIFDYQKASVAQKGFCGLSMDLRGFGQSDRPGEYDYDTWCEDIGEVIKELGLADVTLVGYSMGGAITAHYCATRKDPRISRLILLSAAAPSAARAAEDKTRYDGYIQSIVSGQAQAVSDFSKNLFNTPISAEYEQWLISVGQDASLQACVRGLEELRDRDLGTELEQITVPTLICHGKHDKIMPVWMAKEQKQLIKDSVLVRFRESGHGLFLDEKNNLAEWLVKFSGFNPQTG